MADENPDVKVDIESSEVKADDENAGNEDEVVESPAGQLPAKPSKDDLGMERVKPEKRGKVSYRDLFYNVYKPNAEGKVQMKEFKATFIDIAKEANYKEHEMEKLLAQLDKNGDNMVEFSEFVDLMTKCARERAKRAQVWATKFAVPKSERAERLMYLDQYNCWPPPLFIILITIAEIVAHIINCVEQPLGFTAEKAPTKSVLIWHPYCRVQFWRYLTYMLTHVGPYHLFYNCFLQVAIGVPVEMVHKFWRVGLIYLGGVIAGSVAHSIMDYKSLLAGASGGVYALLAAHVSSVIINWSEMEYALIRAVVFLGLVGMDLGMALWRRYKEGTALP